MEIFLFFISILVVVSFISQTNAKAIPRSAVRTVSAKSKGKFASKASSSRQNKKLTLSYMFRAFFESMIDPTFAEDEGVSSSPISSSTVPSYVGIPLGTSSAGSFPVCGPNGCH